MKSETHRRLSLRLKGYDYARPGAYFVTICTHDRVCLFGEVVEGEVVPDIFGSIVQEEWFRSADIRQEIELRPDEFVVMPNHLHGIVWIIHAGVSMTPVGAHGRAPLRRAPRSLGAFVAGFKSAATRRINARRGTPGTVVWQRNYYEHIIRDEQALGRIRAYIANNPLQWDLDRENPANLAAGSQTPPPHGEPWRG